MNIGAFVNAVLMPIMNLLMHWMGTVCQSPTVGKEPPDKWFVQSLGSTLRSTMFREPEKKLNHLHWYTNAWVNASSP